MLFLQILVLFALIIEHIVHHSIKGLIATVILDLFDGGIKDGVLKLFSKSIPEGIFSCRDVVD